MLHYYKMFLLHSFGCHEYCIYKYIYIQMTSILELSDLQRLRSDEPEQMSPRGRRATARRIFRPTGESRCGVGDRRIKVLALCERL